MRRDVKSSAASVRPADGKKTAPAAGAFRYQNVKSAPRAYKPPRRAASTR
jgi:hypothetical protein